MQVTKQRQVFEIKFFLLADSINQPEYVSCDLSNEEIDETPKEGSFENNFRKNYIVGLERQ